MVPLKETNESGGYVWDAYRKRDYANGLNDPNTLIAVDRGLNRQKGASDPAEWLPPDSEYHRGYAQAWGAVKLKQQLIADATEIAALRRILGEDAQMPLMVAK